MTDAERKAARYTSRVMRAARKQLGWTQIETSKRLGISQSALSKVENAILIPSAPQWFDFCKMAGISADSLMSGYIDFHQTATVQTGRLEGGFRLPTKYSNARGSNARAMLPFLSYCRSSMGEAKFEEYLYSVGVDPDYFVHVDNQISLQFCLDLSKTLIREGALKPRDVTRLVKPVGEAKTHGGLGASYARSDSPLARIKLILMNARHYECNFTYTIENEARDRIEFSVKPEAHLAELKYRDDSDLGDFLCRYKRQYFERFAAFDSKAKPGAVSLHEKECHYNSGASSCVYQLRLAS